MKAADYSALDEALELLSVYGPEYHGGMTNHAPMAAEALCALGRSDAVIPWLEVYRKELLPAPTPRERIGESQWRSLLGKTSRVADWMAFFANEMEERGWRSVLAIWVPRFAPGIVSAAAHGAIRTGHAVRGIAQQETPQRRRELADALGYWASTYQTLPEGEGPRHNLRPSQAISRVAILPLNERGQFRAISEALTQLQTFAPFAEAANLVDTSGEPGAFLSDLSAAFAKTYLANAKNFLGAIVFVHAMTGPSALRPMLPYLPAEAASVALRYAWQAAAGLLSVYSIPGVEEGRAEGQAPNAEELADRAIESGDEHAIKFAEVCLREYALNPQPEYLAASLHASGMLRR